MVSAATTANKTTVDDAAAALLRSNSAKADANTPRATAPATNDADQSVARGPAVLVTLSAPTDLATRQKALSDLKAGSDDLANALSDQLQNGTDALNTLDQAAKSTAADRKKDAEEKLERARAKLQLLQMLGGDPKSMAQQAKDIGKEIKNAASEYTTALKDEAGGRAAAAPAAATDPTAKAAGDDATTAANAAATPVASTETAATPVGTADAGAASPAAGSTAASPAVQSPADAAAAKAAAYKLGQHDRDVLTSFKDAANQVKQITEEAARRLKEKNAADPAARGGPQATAEMDKAVSDLAETIQIKQSGGDISDSAALPTIPAVAPSVDILA